LIHGICNHFRVLPPFPLRLLRSDREAKVTLYFNIFLGIFIFIISTMVGTALELKRIFGIARKPVGPSIGFCCQFVLMPTIGFLLAEFGLPEDATSLKMALFATSTLSQWWQRVRFGASFGRRNILPFQFDDVTQTLAALFMMPWDVNAWSTLHRRSRSNSFLENY
ncbi:hypothetical protein OSTOST_01277, partial [Ostertagia ostertagi]